eukprot:4377783-Pyramimonas_sp.AAC.1
MFEEPAHSRLPTPASWASVEIGLSDGLILSQMDVDSAFYRCKAPPGVAEYFALPRVSAKHLHRANPKLTSKLDLASSGYVDPHLE